MKYVPMVCKLVRMNKISDEYSKDRCSTVNYIVLDYCWKWLKICEPYRWTVIVYLVKTLKCIINSDGVYNGIG